MNIITRKTAAVGLTMTGLLTLCAPAQSISSSEDGGTEVSSVVFNPMFLVGKGSGAFEVSRSGSKAEAGKVGHAYPYGSRVVVKDEEGTKVILFLAPNEAIVLGRGSDVLIEDDPEKTGGKRVKLFAGKLETSFSKDDKAVLPVSIVAPSAVFDDFDGRVAVSAASSAVSAKSTVSVTDGKVVIHAPQLRPSRLGNTASLVLETKTDESFTVIEGLAGDYKLYLENGNEADYEADFHVGSRIKIWRGRAPLSKLLAVSVLIADADGAVADSYAFNEGQAPIKNGFVAVKEDASAEEDADVGASADNNLTGLGDDFGIQSNDAGTGDAATDTGWDFNF